MYLDKQNRDGGMRPLPPEEAEVENTRKSLDDNIPRRSKTTRPKMQNRNSDVRHLTRRLESFAENETSSDSEALRLIEDTRGTILKLRLIKKNNKNKSKGRHDSPHTSKKLPPKYGLH